MTLTTMNNDYYIPPNTLQLIIHTCTYCLYRHGYISFVLTCAKHVSDTELMK